MACLGAREAWVSSAILNAALYPRAWEAVAKWCLIVEGKGGTAGFKDSFL